MNQRNEQTDDIDLIELLGVIIKWRKVLIVFVLVCTVLSGLLLVVKEYKKYKNIETNIKADKNAGMAKFVEVKRAPTSNIFKFIQQTTPVPKLDYDTFISKLLFPIEGEKPIFTSVAYSNEPNDFRYVFVNDTDMNTFKTTYLQLLAYLRKLITAKTAMSDSQFALCTYNLLNKLEQKDPACLNYLYAQNYISDKISYAISTKFTVDMVFLDVVSSVMGKFKDEFVTIGQKELSTQEEKGLVATAIRGETGNGFGKYKLLKYLALVFVLSVFLSVFLAFVLEFWVKNRERIRKYL